MNLTVIKSRHFHTLVDGEGPLVDVVEQNEPAVFEGTDGNVYATFGISINGVVDEDSVYKLEKVKSRLVTNYKFVDTDGNDQDELVDAELEAEAMASEPVTSAMSPDYQPDADELDTRDDDSDVEDVEDDSDDEDDEDDED